MSAFSVFTGAWVAMRGAQTPPHNALRGQPARIEVLSGRPPRWWQHPIQWYRRRRRRVKVKFSHLDEAR